MSRKQEANFARDGLIWALDGARTLYRQRDFADGYCEMQTVRPVTLLKLLLVLPGFAFGTAG